MSNKALSRRNFLSQTMALTGAGILAPSFSFASTSRSKQKGDSAKKVFKNILKIT